MKMNNNVYVLLIIILLIWKANNSNINESY